MELRDLANSEASAFIDRLVAAAEDRSRAARAEAEEQVAKMRTQLEALRIELESETARAATLESDLDSVIEAHRQVDGERIKAEAARNQEASAKAKAEEELRIARERLDRVRNEAARISESLEEEATQRALLQEELQSVRLVLAGLEKSRDAAENKIATLERRVSELEGIEASLRGELTEATARAAAVESEAAAEVQELRVRYDVDIRAVRSEAEAIAGDRETIRKEADALRAEVSTVRAEVKSLQSESDTLRAEGESNRGQADTLRAERDNAQRERDSFKTERDALKAERDTLKGERDTLGKQAAGIERERDALRKEAEALKTLVAALRREGEALKALPMSGGGGNSEEIRSLQEMLDASREHYERQTAMFSGTLQAVEGLGATKTIAELFNALVGQVGKHLPRVALFRVKGNHLEGEYGSGVDESVQLKKIVIPMNMDSVISRAATGGVIVRADGNDLASSRAPFGGSPVSAIAAPLSFQGETLAVVYADSDSSMTTAQTTFTQIMVRHAGVLLSRLTQELKALKELRDYAQMLLQEAEQMFVADVDSGRPAHDSIKRLRDTVDCGRQLFAQRAAMEGTEAAGVFDEQVSIVINAQASPFAEALAAATRDSKRAAS
jgi:chromosome segregation ATPase